ncbi:MAG: hypothetical protein V4801_11800 [Burkholderia gladioli]
MAASSGGNGQRVALTMPLPVLPDANVLFSATLRDIFMWLHVHRCIQLRWSRQIDDEWRRNVIKHNRMTATQVRCCVDAMRIVVPDWEITGHERHARRFDAVDPNDRHVAAAAYRWSSMQSARQPIAVVLVTHNMRHFPAKAFASSAVTRSSPDQVLTRLATHETDHVMTAINAAQQRYRMPAISRTAFVDALMRNRC